MKRPTRWKGIAALAVALAAPWPATAAAIEVQRLGCREGIRVRIDGVSATDVIAKLAYTLQFRLSGQTTDRSPVSLRGSFQPRELMDLLALQANNLIVQYEPDVQCAGQLRIKRVWILARGSTASPPALPVPSAPAPELDPGLRMYMQAHGHALPASAAK